MCRRGPAKVKAHKSILFTEGSPEVERKSEHLFDMFFGRKDNISQIVDRVTDNDEKLPCFH